LPPREPRYCIPLVLSQRKACWARAAGVKNRLRHAARRNGVFTSSLNMWNMLRIQARNRAFDVALRKRRHLRIEQLQRTRVIFVYVLTSPRDADTIESSITAESIDNYRLISGWSATVLPRLLRFFSTLAIRCRPHSRGR